MTVSWTSARASKVLGDEREGSSDTGRALSQKDATAQWQHVKGEQDGCLGHTFPLQPESIHPKRCPTLRYHQGKYVLLRSPGEVASFPYICGECLKYMFLKWSPVIPLGIWLS